MLNTFFILSILILESVIALQTEVIVPSQNYKVTLVCRDKTIWLDPRNNVINPSSKYTINNGSLTINSLEENDLGKYMCIMNGKRRNITVYAAPHIMRLEKSKQVKLNDPIFLKCSFWGLPKPSQVWVKNETSYLDVVAREPNLNITKSEMKDSGSYFCHASNNHGRFRMRIKIRVKDPKDALVPFIGIIIEIVILLIIIIAYEWSHKRKFSTIEPTFEANGAGKNR